MALPILDGNQSATTLATTVSGGAHYPNHIIASSVTISSLPSISGTVTANVFGFDQANNEFVPITCLQAEEGLGSTSYVVGVQIANVNGHITSSNPLPISGTVTANAFENVFIKVYPTGNDWNSGILERVSKIRWEDRSGSSIEYKVGNPTYGDVWEARYGDNNALYATNNNNQSSIPPISGWNVIIGDNFTISYEKYATQAISGTVTANGGDFVAENEGAIPNKGVQIGFYEIINDADFKFVNNSGNAFPVQIVAGNYTATQPISGTVTANVFGYDKPNDEFTQISVQDAGENITQFTSVIPVGIANNGGGITTNNPLPISGTVTIGSLPVQLSTTTIGGTARLNVTLSSATTVGATVPSYGNLYGGSDGTNLRAILVDSSGRTTVTGSVSILGTPSVTMGAISGTVTANVASTTVTVSALPSGALTTRFGSVTTANTAQITTAVTNASRKYLLAQNISAGTVTIGIGFSPTTTQGIQLTAGAGLTFDSFVPTGAVYWLGATTGAAYTILEG